MTLAFPVCDKCAGRGSIVGVLPSEPPCPVCGGSGTRPFRVYVCGPYEAEQAVNVRAAVAAAEQIVDAGHLPYVPHLYHLWDLVSCHSQAYYVAMDRAWLVQCDVMVVLDVRQSTGVRGDVEAARQAGIPYMWLSTFRAQFGDPPRTQGDHG